MTVVMALGVLLAVGHALLALLVRTLKLYWFERWALAFLIGTAVTSGLWIAFSAFYDVISPVWLLSILSLLVIVAARSRIHLRYLRVPAMPKLAWLEAGLSFLLAAEFALLLLASLHTPLGWDGLFNFELKARLIFENTPSGRFPIAYLSDASRAWSHPQYPLMVPFAEFWIYSWLGRVDQAAIKILFPLFYFSLVGVLCGAIRRISDARISLAIAVAIGLLPPFTLLPGAASGYADVPLAAALAGSVSFAFLALRTGNTEAWTLAGVLSAIATWTKSEGVLLAGCVGIVALAALLWNRRSTALKQCATNIGSLRSMLALLWIPLVAAGPWLLLQQRYGLPSVDFLPLSAGVMIENVGRLPAIVKLVGRELLLPGHWGLIWPAFGSALLVMIRVGRADASKWFLIGTVVLPLVLYSLVFMWSAWSDPMEHARWALPRLLVPLAPMALVFTVFTLYSEGSDPFYAS